MDDIIDVHGHLGDILYPGGGRLIDRRGVTRQPVFDPTARSEAMLHRDPLGLGKLGYTLFARAITRAERARNATATLENFRRSLDEARIRHAVCLPVPPHVTFADLRRAADEDPSVVPFTGVDYTREGDPGAEFAEHVRAGARGLKLHPIIQKVPLTSPATRAAVEAFAPHELPVLFHCGISSYYLGSERSRQEPRYGAIHYAARLVRDFPGVRFIAAHSGLFEVKQVMQQLGGLSNVWVDTSFQSVARVRQLIGVFGRERVLFASDWPYGNRPPALEIVRRVCGGDRGLERRILFENAAELLRIATAA
ncbi:MAG: amidohydrolase [Myxococcales bacterium]|nr:amidohydrolase [Myxococcales bacterium]